MPEPLKHTQNKKQHAAVKPLKKTIPVERDLLTRLGDVIGLALIGLIAMRAIASFHNGIVVDFLPDSIDRTVVMYGPFGTAFTDVLLILLAMLTGWLKAATLWRSDHEGFEWQAKHMNIRAYWIGYLLWLLGAVFVFAHISPVGNVVWREAVSWVAILGCGVSVYALMDDPKRRLWLLSGLIALVAPMAVSILEYVYITQPDNVAKFEANPEALLTQFGLTPGTAGAIAFERRLRGVDASGHMVTSNLMGTMMGMTLVLFTFAVLSLAWQKIDDPEKKLSTTKKTLIGMVIFAGGLIAGNRFLLDETGSRGAALSFVIGILSFAAFRLLNRIWYMLNNMKKDVRLGSKRRLKIFHGSTLIGALIGVSVLILPWIAVIHRAMQGVQPAGVDQERSLLFRSMYWMGGWQIFKENWISGVGPGRYHDYLLMVRDPRLPEEPFDAHNMLVSWVTGLGIGGVFWVFLLLCCLWQIGRGYLDAGRRGLPAKYIENRKSFEWSKPAIMAAIIAVLILVIVPLFLNIQVNLGYWVGAFLFGGMWVALSQGGWDRHPSSMAIITWGVCVAAIVGVVHAQIDMGATNVMTGPFLGALVGAAVAYAGLHYPEKLIQRGLRFQSRVGGRRWERVLSRLFASRGSGIMITVPGSLVLLGFLFMGWHVMMVELQLRNLAYNAMDNRDRQVSDDYEMLKDQSPGDPRAAFIYSGVLLEKNESERAWSVLSDLDTGVYEAGSITMKKSMLAYGMYQRTNERVWYDRAIQSLSDMETLDPFNGRSRIMKGHLLWTAGDLTAAVEQYQHALVIMENKYLDPIRLLSDDERDLLQSRINSVIGVEVIIAPEP